MTRDIIEINEALCDGCGDCIIGCSEGAIKIVDGKARLVKEEFCDGFGDCVGACPTGALKIVRRSAPGFDETATVRHLLETQGPEAVRRFQEAQARHEHSHGGGCPGFVQREIPRGRPAKQEFIQLQDLQVRPSGNAPPGPAPPPGPAAFADPAVVRNSAAAQTIIPSELGQWPVQLHLVQPMAPFFNGKELVVMNTCGPVASAEVHQRYLRNRSVVVACPKLDNTAPYMEKLTGIFRNTSIPKVIVVRMEVPCCSGLTQFVAEAYSQAGREDLIVDEHVLSLEGNIKSVRTLTG